MLIIFYSVSYTQDPYHVNFNANDGLPSVELYDVEVDSLNRLWIGTDRGLCIYDGYSFKTLTTDDGLSNNTIFEVFIDSKGRILLAGYDSSLTIIEGDSIKILPVEDVLTSAYPISWVQRIIEGKDANYYLMLYPLRSQFNNVFQFDLNTERTTTYNAPSNVSSTVETLTLSDGIVSFFNNKTKIGNFKSIPINQDSFIYGRDKYDQYYHTLKVEGHQLPSSFDADSYVFIGKDNEFVDTLFRLDSDIQSMEKLNDEYYLATSSNLVKFSLSDSSNYFNNELITSITSDNESSIWFTTHRSGLYNVPNFNIKKYINHNISSNIFKLGLLNDDLILSEDRGNGLHILNNIDEELYTLRNEYWDFPEFLIVDDTLITNGFNKVYREGSEYKIKNRRNTLKKEDQTIAEAKRISFRAITQLDPNSYLSAIRALTKYIFQNKETVEEISYELNTSLVTDLYNDKKGTIWISSLDGLSKVGITNIEQRKPVLDSLGLLNTRINSIQNYFEKGLIISSSGNGLLIYDPSQNDVIQISLEDGLSSKLINNAFVENDSTIWLATNNGLNKVEFYQDDKVFFKLKNIQSINTTDGLLSNYIYDVIKWREDIWVATQSGVCYFNDNDVKIPLKGPKMFFDSVMIGNLNIYKSDLNQLKHDQNDITFHYTGVSYRKPKNKQFYQYTLKSNNSPVNWKSTNQRSVQFTNLDPGDYNFYVKAQNKYGTWSTPLEYSFTIIPHFTQTWWFRILMFSAILFILWGLYTYRSRIILNRERQKRWMSNAEKRVKQAELNALRNQMNPHFIYNSLNSIQNFIFQDKPEKANYFLTRFSKLIRKSLELSKLEFITLNEELDFLKGYIEMEQMRFEDKFDFEIKIQEGLNLNYKIPPLLIQPLLENAVKHGFKNIDYKGQLVLSIEQIENTLVIYIEDNGSGIIGKDDKSDHTSLSTNIIRERLEIINKTFKEPHSRLTIHKDSYKSEKPGTKIKLELPLIKDSV